MRRARGSGRSGAVPREDAVPVAPQVGVRLRPRVVDEMRAVRRRDRVRQAGAQIERRRAPLEEGLLHRQRTIEDRVPVRMCAVAVPGPRKHGDGEDRERQRTQDPCVAGANPGRREPEHDDGERPERKLPRQLAEAEHDTESDRRASPVPGTDEYPGG